MFFTDDRCGYLSRSRTSTSSSLMFRYWSTDLRVPRTRMSFLSSMVTVWLVRVLKKLFGFHHQSACCFVSAVGWVNLGCG